MAAVTNFQKIQQLLVDPSVKGQQQRANIDQKARIAGVASVALMGLSVVVVTASVVSFVAHPILASLGLVIGGTAFVVAYDIFNISKNIANLVEDRLSNLPSRVFNITSSTQFVAALFQDTLILDEFCKQVAIQRLEEPA